MRPQKHIGPVSTLSVLRGRGSRDSTTSGNRLSPHWGWNSTRSPSATPRGFCFVKTPPSAFSYPGYGRWPSGRFPFVSVYKQPCKKKQKHTSSSTLTANTGVDFYVRNCVSGLRSRGVPSRFPHRAVHVPPKGSGCSPSSPTLDAVSLSHCSKVCSDYSPRHPDD